MSNLANIDYETIENKIMMVLVQNQGKLLSAYNLYEKVLDKLDYIKDIKFIDPQFKYNFLITMKSLPAKYDDIEIININKLSYAVFNNNDQEDELINRILPEPPIDRYNLPSKNETIQYIVDNNLYKYFYCDNKTTIFHDLVIGSNYLQVDKLLSEKKMKVNVIDNNGKVPIDYIDDLKISNLFIKDLYNKIEFLENKIKTFDDKIEIIENKNKYLENTIINLNNDLKISLFNLILKKLFNMICNKPKTSFLVLLILIFILYKNFIN